ncbi:RidA family protein [Acidovorax sp. BL-A-41-H1]|uniref:RidA family protein n=1 Tax=Acidovorax sp. BL-A-41-H1 TaxID=3421102 RepID=UPI003F79DAB5
MNEAEIAAGMPGTPSYQYAQQVGNQLFLVGQVPQAADGSIVAPGDPHAQASKCLANLGKLLAIHGFAVPDIRRLVVYVVGEQANLSTAWSAVTEHFGGQVPAATLLGVARLGYPGQVVEIDATVVKGP